MRNLKSLSIFFILVFQHLFLCYSYVFSYMFSALHVLLYKSKLEMKVYICMIFKSQMLEKSYLFFKQYPPFGKWDIKKNIFGLIFLSDVFQTCMTYAEGSYGKRLQRKIKFIRIKMYYLYSKISLQYFYCFRSKEAFYRQFLFEYMICTTFKAYINSRN